MSRADVIGRGDRVTGQNPTWHDGQPVAGWPNPQYVGTVRKVDSWHGCTYARVKFDSGRLEWVNVDTLYRLEASRA